MASLDTDRLLAMLRDPNVESRDIASAAGVAREEAGRASRLLLGIAKAKPEEVSTLPAPLAAAIARAALGAARADLLAALAAHPEKEVAKEAKRGLHVLRTRGVAVPEPPRPAAAAPPPPPEPALAAYASAVDGSGERAVWIPRNVPGKGIEVGQAVVSDTQGLLELQIGLVGRKEWRGIVKGLVSEGAAMGVGEVDPARARAIVAAARALNDRSGKPVPGSADVWLGQLGPVAPLPDPADAFPPLPPDEEREALAASAALHDLPMLAGWLADEEYLRAVAARLDEIAVSPLYIDERQRAEQAARAVADAVDGYLDADRRRVLAARLFTVAEDLRARGDAGHARAAAAAARAIAGGAPASAVPFARLLVEKAFPPAGPAGPDAPEPPPESSLLVSPR
ncbi:MAG TPA: hypothetical protein VF841_09940 [Anaeromyxobacter sp.]